ncbi:hypothetical protein Dimus_027265, partial [Dionaea muscipula]
MECCLLMSRVAKVVERALQASAAALEDAEDGDRGLRPVVVERGCWGAIDGGTDLVVIEGSSVVAADAQDALVGVCQEVKNPSDGGKLVGVLAAEDYPPPVVARVEECFGGAGSCRVGDCLTSVDGAPGGSIPIVNRSYAQVVYVDRQADVELRYFPPVDGGNAITMEESDGEPEQWGSCL